MSRKSPKPSTKAFDRIWEEAIWRNVMRDLDSFVHEDARGMWRDMKPGRWPSKESKVEFYKPWLNK